MPAIDILHTRAQRHAGHAENQTFSINTFRRGLLRLRALRALCPLSWYIIILTLLFFIFSIIYFTFLSIRTHEQSLTITYRGKCTQSLTKFLTQSLTMKRTKLCHQTTLFYWIRRVKFASIMSNEIMSLILLCRRIGSAMKHSCISIPPFCLCSVGYALYSVLCAQSLVLCSVLCRLCSVLCAICSIACSVLCAL